MEVIEVMTYNDWNNKHLKEWKREAAERQRYWNEKHEADRERRLYYCNQRFIGLLVLLIGIIIFVITLEATTLIIAAFGIYIMTSKKMLIVNNYYFKHQGEKQWKM